MSAGHFGAAGRFEELDEVGLIQAFALDVTGLHRPHELTRDEPRPSTVIGARTAPARVRCRPPGSDRRGSARRPRPFRAKI